MTYHDTQGNEIEDLEMDNTQKEPCWLCGDPELWESGLCQEDFAWAENLDASGWGEEELKMLYEAETRAGTTKLARFAHRFWVVTKATDNSTLGDIMFQTDAQGLIRQARGGLHEDDVLLTTCDADEALRTAELELEGRAGER